MPSLKGLLVSLVTFLLLIGSIEGVFRLNESYRWFDLSRLGTKRIPKSKRPPPPLIENLSDAYQNGPYRDWAHPLDGIEQLKGAEELAESIKPTFPLYPGENSGFKRQLFKAAVYLKRDPSEVVYRTDFILDENERRAVASSRKGGAPSLVFMGCSFTFGQGVGDGETFPDQFSRLVPQAAVVNYGRPGYGPNDFLDEFQFDSVRTRIPEEWRPIVVYTMFTGHLERALCSINLCTVRVPRRLEGGYYDYGPSGQIERRGAFKDHFPWNQAWLPWLERSSILRGTGMTERRISDADLERAADIFGLLRDKVSARWRAKRFVIAFYPNRPSPSLDKLKPLLERRQIEVIDLSRLPYDPFHPGFLADLPYDHHPNPPTHYIYAWSLRSELRRRGLIPPATKPEPKF